MVYYACKQDIFATYGLYYKIMHPAKHNSTYLHFELNKARPVSLGFALGSKGYDYYDSDVYTEKKQWWAKQHIRYELLCSSSLDEKITVLLMNMHLDWLP